MLINIIVEQGIPGELIVPVEEALQYLANFVRINLGVDVEIQQLGYWRTEGYMDGAQFVPHKSINWFLEMAYLERVSDDSINPATILREAMSHSLQASRCPLTIFVVKQKIVHPEIRWVRAATTKFWSSVISIHEFLPYLENTRYEMIHTLSLHEFGHLFGLVDEKRVISVVDFFGLHCTVKGCVMRQGATIASWAQMGTEWREKGNPYCELCRQELRYNVKKLKSR